MFTKGLYTTALLVTLLGSLPTLFGSCGYKASPSPLLDEEERFGDAVRRRQDAEAKPEAKPAAPASESIHWLQQSDPSAPCNDTDQHNTKGQTLCPQISPKPR